MQKSARLTHLTFDCYGTLIDWRTGIEQELARALGGGVRLGGARLLDAYVEAEKSQESTYKKYGEVLRGTVISMSEVLGVEVTDSAAREFAASVPKWPVFQDTAKFLREIGSRGLGRYILSNVDNDLLEETIVRHGLEVDGFVTAEEVGSYKPNPAHWIRFMEKTGTHKGNILHCAQSVYHDIIPTQSMGIASAWVNRYDEKLDQGVEPLYICDSLENLARVLG
ncbi:MAG TPA: HAD-IA family hydrolase [Nitrososphaerales archaeon]|nr:HAD-IA family hydrolase [Nitrososphaerales archaeon]